MFRWDFCLSPQTQDIDENTKGKRVEGKEHVIGNKQTNFTNFQVYVIYNIVALACSPSD